MAEEEQRLARLPAFNAWLEDHAVSHPKVVLASDGHGHGLSIHTTDAIRPGDAVISVPLSSLLNTAAVAGLFPDACAFVGREHPDPCAAVYLFLATERSIGDASDFAAVISVLPRVVRTPVSFTDAEMGAMRGTNLHEAALGIRAKLRALSDGVYPRLHGSFPEAFHGCSECRYEDVVWAYEVFWSRCFAVHIGGEDVPSLVPLCGMLNHSPDSKVTYVTDEAAGVFQIRSEMDVPAGVQFFNNYRHRSNEKLLLNYGFVCDDNPLDSFTLKVGVADDSEDPLVARKVEMLKERWIPWEHYLTADRDDPIPQSLMDCMRILCLSEHEAYFIERSQPNNQPVNERNEIEALRTLGSLLRRQLGKLAFRDTAADRALLQSEQCKADSVMRSIVLYRLGQAEILANSARVAGGLLAKAMDRASSGAVRKLCCVPAGVELKDPASIDAFNEVALKMGVFRGIKYHRDSADGSVRVVSTGSIGPGDVVMRFPVSGALFGFGEICALMSKGVTSSVASQLEGEIETLAALFILDSPRGKSPLLDAFFCLLLLRSTALPESIATPVSVSPDYAERLLAGTSASDQCAEMRSQFAEEHKQLRKLFLKASASKSHGKPLDKFVVARVLAETRIVESCDGEPALIPLPVHPRHSPYHKLERAFDRESMCYVVRSTCALSPGDELFDSAGSDCSADHLLRFGFVIRDNDMDVHEVSLESPSSSDDRRAELMEKLRLGNDHLLKKGVFPRKLVDFVRVLEMDEAHINDLLLSDVPSLPADDGAEAEACATAAELLEGVAGQFCDEQDDSSDGAAAASGVYEACDVYTQNMRAIVEDSLQQLRSHCTE